MLGVVPRYPKKDTKTELTTVSLQGGGPTATAIAAAATLGASTRFVGKVADDDFGRFAIRSLEGLGVDVRGVVYSTGSLSPLSFIAVDGEDGSRTIFHTSGDNDPLSPDEIRWTVLDGASCLLVDGHQPAAQLAAARRCRERGIPVILDAGSPRDGLDQLVAHSDVLIASERFAADVAPRGELEDTVRGLAALGPTTVVVTLGDSGSVGVSTDGRRPKDSGELPPLVRQAAFPVTAVDTTGAGDVFHGAFAVALTAGDPFERCLRFASAAASLKCRTLGGRAGLPTPYEVTRLLGAST
jgi:ribokinase